MKQQKIVKILELLNNSYGNTMLARLSSLKIFQLLIATILSARSRDEVTEPIARNLFKHYPNADSLSRADINDVEKLIKSIGFYRNKARMIIGAAKKIEEIGRVPDTMEELLEIPGVGRKVAGCVLVYGHGRDAIPVDTHVHRLSNRIGLVKTKMPEQTEKELMNITPKKYWKLVNDLLVYHGKNICIKKPKCYECLISKHCSYKNKTPKHL